MNERIKNLIFFWKASQNFYISADALVAKGPGFLYTIKMVVNSTDVGTSVVYDGYGTVGKKLFDLGAVKSSEVKNDYNPPLYFEQGLYIDVGSNITSISGQFVLTGER